jgi:hypothetical protein
VSFNSAARATSVKNKSSLYSDQIPHFEIGVDRAFFGAATPSSEVDETRPEDGPKSVFEPGYRVKVRPGAPLQNALDRGVVDTCELPGCTEAHLPHSSLEVQRELSGDLAAGVVRGHVWPFLRAFAGRGAERPGHDSSVDDTDGASE